MYCAATCLDGAVTLPAAKLLAISFDQVRECLAERRLRTTDLPVKISADVDGRQAAHTFYEADLDKPSTY